MLYFLFIVIITIGYEIKYFPISFYNFIAIIIFGAILIFSATVEFNNKKVEHIISILSENTYAFYLAQFFTWTTVKLLPCEKFHLIISFFICTLLTLIFHYGIELNVKKIFKKGEKTI